MGSVCRGERLTRRGVLKDIAGDFGFSNCGAPEYTAGRAGSAEDKMVDPSTDEQRRQQNENINNRVSLFYAFQEDARRRYDSLGRSLVLISGGALTLSIGALLQKSRLPLAPETIEIVRWAWLSLFGCIFASLGFIGASVWSQHIYAKHWEQDFYGSKPRPWGSSVLNRLQILLVVLALFLFVGGLAGLAWAALSVVSAPVPSTAALSNALQLTPNSFYQSVCGAILAAGGSVPVLAVSAVWCS